MSKIVQIVPAQPGWVAEFDEPNGPNDDGPFMLPVAVWALVEYYDDEVPYRKVVGMTAWIDGVEIDEEKDNFVGWSFQPEVKFPPPGYVSMKHAKAVFDTNTPSYEDPA